MTAKLEVTIWAERRNHRLGAEAAVVRVVFLLLAVGGEFCFVRAGLFATTFFSGDACPFATFFLLKSFTIRATYALVSE